MFSYRARRKYFRLCSPQDSTVKAAIDNIYRWIWLSSNKILFTKIGDKLNLACMIQFADPWSRGSEMVRLLDHIMRVTFRCHVLGRPLTN